MFKFYEKETSSSKTVQKRSAMEENSKQKILANDLIRRLSNSMEQLGKDERLRKVDGSAVKLLNSRFKVEQVRKIVINGIKGFEGRKKRCSAEGRSLYRTANESQGARELKKLVSKMNWYRKGTEEDPYEDGREHNGKKKGAEVCQGAQPKYKSVLFVEQTVGGELSRRLREVLQRLAPVMGFTVKVVEWAGASLQSNFPQASIWEGAHCGRELCITCNQGADEMEQCTRKSALYENVCGICNKGAAGKGAVKGSNPDIASIYVGETSRTIQERAVEHWAAYNGSKKAKEGSHIAKHVELHHPSMEPLFYMKVVGFYRSALSRQTAEAVRIRRRGGEGAVLNSKAEFNRCYLPRLRLADEKEVVEMEQAEEQENNVVLEELKEKNNNWINKKTQSRSKGSRSEISRSKATKKPREQAGGARPSKRRKFELIGGGWGEKTTENGAQTTLGMRLHDIRERSRDNVNMMIRKLLSSEERGMIRKSRPS